LPDAPVLDTATATTSSTAKLPLMDWSWFAEAFAEGDSALGHDFDLDYRNKGTMEDLALVLISTPLSESRLRSLWSRASLRLLADGAGNRLARYCTDLQPDIFLGDFDSAEDWVIEEYRGRGVDVRDLAWDQDSTDLDKSLKAARAAGATRLLVAGQFAGVEGRVDHFFGIANSLHRHQDLPIVVVGNDSYMCLLAAGRHLLKVPRPDLRPHCGLVPLGQPCPSVTTKGLKYDMDQRQMEFGGLISVCNRVEPDQGGIVEVETATPLLWTCTLPPMPPSESDKKSDPAYWSRPGNDQSRGSQGSSNSTIGQDRDRYSHSTVAGNGNNAKGNNRLTVNATKNASE